VTCRRPHAQPVKEVFAPTKHRASGQDACEARKGFQTFSQVPSSTLSVVVQTVPSLLSQRLWFAPAAGKKLRRRMAGNVTVLPATRGLPPPTARCTLASR
jgi:hypothetical protein